MQQGHVRVQKCVYMKQTPYGINTLQFVTIIFSHLVSYPAAHSHVAFLIDAKAFSLAKSKYTWYRPAFMDGVILHLTWQ